MKLTSLKSNKDFEEFREKRPKRFDGRFLLILSLEKDIEQPKLGVRISKRVGNAVRRNRIRRIIRETIRQDIDKIEQNRHYLVIPRQSTKNLSDKKLSLGIRQDLSRGLGFKL